jgi:aminoglycoside/choline kinase family phosphotransferase
MVRRAFYESALGEIVKLHCLPEEARLTIQKNLPAEFDAALYRWEQNYFFENCLGRFFGVEANELASVAALPSLGRIAEELAERPRVLVHRDFQSQNIIIRNGQAHLIDFQGMRPGLAEYDLASLLFDPYVVLSQAERDELLDEYGRLRRAAGHPLAPDSRSIFCRCAIQRLMQALGAYGFLGLVKGNKAFLDHIPAALHSLRTLIGEISDLGKLRDALDRVS